MAIFRSREDIVLAFLETLRTTQPLLDTKPGTVSRDLFIDAQAEQLELLYNTIFDVSRSQSLEGSTASRLDREGSNYGLTRNPATVASGTALLTLSEFIGDTDINIPEGSIISTRGGISFRIIGTNTISRNDRNLLASVASLNRAALDAVGISDIFAFEVQIEAISPGTLGNVAAFLINRHSIPNISRVVNVLPTLGGTDSESDADFRNRIKLSISGNNVGTENGFLNTVLVVPGVLDAFVAGPGNPLQVRDETIVFLDDSGQLQIQQEGLGGAVDIFVLGSDNVEKSESFVYNDQSGRNDATDPSNDIILGQVNATDLNLTLSERRTKLLAAETLPTQPVTSVVSMTGSVSGPNFIEAFTDSDTGELKGNFQLVKDSSTVSGSSFAIDKIHFISNEIKLDDEDITKGEINSQDTLTFPGVSIIRSISQDIDVINEHPTIDPSQRNFIPLRLPQGFDVTRVFNVTTGERYTVETQPSGINSIVEISGDTLPVLTDVLQVDYTFKQQFDKDIDYADPSFIQYPRSIIDSADWSRSNLIDPEFSTVVVTGPNRNITVSQQVGYVFSVKDVVTEEELFILGSNMGTFSNNIITLPVTSTVLNGTDVKVTYLADVLSLLDSTDIADFADNTVNNLLIQPVTLQSDGFGDRFLRYAPTRLQVNVTNTSNKGTVHITGDTFEKVEESTFTVTSSIGNPFLVDLASIIRSARGLSASSSLNNFAVAKVLKVENLTKTQNGEPYNYDLTGYKLKDNSFDFINAIEDTSISSSTAFLIPGAGDNVNFVPSFNNSLRITFYFTERNRVDSILFSEDGEQLTSEPFFIVSDISVSGFADTDGVFNGSMSINATNQPLNFTIYQANYNYRAPKENERLTITYAFNKIITDTTLSVEEKRPVTADVLVREAESIFVNVTVSIIVDPTINVNLLNFSEEVKNSISRFLTANELGTTVDSSDIVRNIYSDVVGVDRVVVNLFERQDNPGNALSISVEDNQSVSPGNIIVNLESRS
jgi:phage-related baseplate assembly protein